MSKLFGLFKKAAKSPLYKTRGEEFRYWKQYEESEKMSAIVSNFTLYQTTKFLNYPDLEHLQRTN